MDGRFASASDTRISAVGPVRVFEFPHGHNISKYPIFPPAARPYPDGQKTKIQTCGQATMHALGSRPGLRPSFFTYIQQLGYRDVSRPIRTTVFRRPRSSHSHRPRRGESDQLHKPGSQARPSPTSLTQSAPRLFLRPFLRLFNWYARQQKTRPYITQLWSTPLIFCIGDLSAQGIGDDDYDPQRSIRAIAVGAVISIPNYMWIIALGNRFNYSSTALSIGTKVAVNQLVYTPPFNVYFFAFHALLSGEDVAGAVEHVKNSVPVSIPRSCLYWPVATAISFAYVQPQFRAGVLGLFTIVWQSYLSWLNRRTQKHEQMGRTGLDAPMGS